ncbi:hypothetical protein [Halobacillus sp. B23F22_1]|uniref:hypothetical protein n=1 Tax=Halobacillus sp. B23F22_1 TaxID=3459514 RepID=UPI00373E4638
MIKKIIIGAALLIIAGLALFGPYSLIREFNEEAALKDFISSDNTFKGLEVTNIDYRGSETYFIQTQKEGKMTNFILMRHHTSVMNGHWKVFLNKNQSKNIFNIV